MSGETRKITRKDYISLLTVISMFCVVIIHTNYYNEFSVVSDTVSWHVSNVIESLVYFAVPVFFMISGATLMDYRDRYDTKEFIKRRLLKVGVGFLFWSTVSFFYTGFRGDSSVFDESVFNIIFNIFNGKYMYIYWFLMAILCCYLFIPVISLIPKDKRKHIFVYIIGISLLFNAVFPFITSIGGIEFNKEYTFISGCTYFIYILAGYYIDTYEIGKKTRITIYILGTISLIVIIIGTDYFMTNMPEFGTLLKGYTNITTFFYACGVYLFFKNTGQTIVDKLRLGKAVGVISKYSFAVYLLHMYFIVELYKLLTESQLHSVYNKVLSPIVITLICIIIAAVVKKIPLLKYILP